MERCVKSVGLVGGIGPESTIDYYRRILDGSVAAGASTMPSIVIDSLDVATGLRLAADDHAGLVDYIVGSLKRLAGAGVDFAAITANTPHMVFDEIAPRSPIPLISIVEACAATAKERALNRVALVGTRFTMSAGFYPRVFRRYGIDVVVPSPSDQAWIHERYVNQLLPGDFRDETRDEIIALVRALRDAERIDGVVLGGTELPLLLKSTTIDGLPLLDTTALHVEAILRRLAEP
jgi:aspartate racemase